MEKKCFICERTMAEHECGDEFPEERICDTCSNLIGIHVYEWRSNQWLFGYVQGEPALMVDDDESWFEIDFLINGEIPCPAVYNEIELRWETTDTM